jgi:energy-coupling factor transporter ATP-binding protein EcfA2
MSSIKLNNLSITIKNRVFVNNLSLELNSGDILGIVGSSGSGKTILATSIAGIIQQNLKLEGEITRDYKRLAILFQNPTNQLFSIDVYEELKNSILQSNKIFDNEILKKESKKWGVENLLNKKIDKLSLGEAQQVALASIMISKPDLIILDEPAQYIDEESFNDRFSKIRENLPNSIIIIVEHNYRLINRLSTIIIKLEEKNYSFIKKLVIPSFKSFKIIKTEEKILELKNIKFSYQRENSLINIDNLIIKKGDFLHLK